MVAFRSCRKHYFFCFYAETISGEFEAKSEAGIRVSKIEKVVQVFNETGMDRRNSCGAARKG